MYKCRSRKLLLDDLVMSYYIGGFSSNPRTYELVANRFRDLFFQREVMCLVEVAEDIAESIESSELIVRSDARMLDLLLGMLRLEPSARFADLFWTLRDILDEDCPEVHVIHVACAVETGAAIMTRSTVYQSYRRVVERELDRTFEVVLVRAMIPGAPPCSDPVSAYWFPPSE